MKHKTLHVLTLPLLTLASWLPLAAQAEKEVVGAVYSMSNEAQGNRVLVFDRERGGKLTLAGSQRALSTGGGAKTQLGPGGLYRPGARAVRRPRREPTGVEPALSASDGDQPEH